MTTVQRMLAAGVVLGATMGAVSVPRAYAMIAVAAASDNGTEGTPLVVADKLQVPGKTLKAGTYRIRVVDHLSDRMIVQVAGPKGQPTTFLALPTSSLRSTADGPIIVGGGEGGKPTLRGFRFPDGTVAEFVFPKGEAVSIAKANGTTIPAIDPESEGKVADPSLSRSDMEMVTLWMLSPKPVSPGESGPGIAAAKYQAPPAAAAPAPANTALASVTKPRLRPKPLMAALPHTASDAPLETLLGTCALLSAALLTTRRLRSSSLR